MNKKRFRNYGFWMAVVAQLLLIAQLAAGLFGYTITDEIKTEIVAVVNAVLVLLSILGIVSNPTKPGGKGFNL